jgi:hypothetical protein
LACRGSQIVIGTATPNRVRLTTSEDFLYTEYQLNPRTWLHPITGGLSPTLLTIGGSVEVGGVLTEAIQGPRLPAETPHIYILRRVPGSRAFGLAVPPIPANTDWANAFPDRWSLPAELNGTVTLDRFTQDLSRAASQCESAQVRQ